MTPADPAEPEPADRSLAYVDPRDAKLAFWLGGVDMLLIRVGKGWMIALYLLALVALVGFAALAVPLGVVAVAVALAALGIYQVVNLPYWIAEHNAEVAARREKASRRRQT